MQRHHLWQQLTDYPRWVEYFPNLSGSRVLPPRDRQGGKRIHQVGCKNFILFSAWVEIYLQVTEISSRQIQFRLESGTFENFSADLDLEDYSDGTLITLQGASYSYFSHSCGLHSTGPAVGNS